MQAKRLGLDVEVDVVAETLPRLGTKPGGIRFGRTEQTETHDQNLGISGNGSLPPEMCMRPSSAQRCSLGKTLPGLSRPFSSKAHLSRCCCSRSVSENITGIR